MKTKLLRTIQRKHLAMIGVILVGSTVLLCSALLLVRAIDQLVLLSNAIQEHAMGTSKPRVSLANYLRSEDQQYLEEYLEQLEALDRQAAAFSLIGSRLAAGESVDQVALIIDKATETYTTENSRDLVRLIGLAGSLPEIKRLVSKAAATRPIYEDMKGLGRELPSTTSAQRREQITVGIEDGLAEVDVLIAGFSATLGQVSNAAMAGAKIALALVYLLSLVAGVTLALRISRSITRPLQETVEFGKRVAEGDLTQRLELRTDDEIVDVAAAMNAICENIGKSIHELSKSTQALTASGEQLSGVSQRLAAGADKTSTQVTTVSGTSEQVNQSMGLISTSIEEINTGITEVAANSAKANQVANRAVEVAGGTQDEIKELSTSSAAIGDIVSVITSIAEQTNLLALNATIEAARAGESGKGFAVVANEVKALAGQTSSATLSISESIRGIQAGIANAAKAVSEIVLIIDHINEFQTTIAANVEEQSALTNEIKINIQEGTRGSSDIAANISGVAETARASSDAAELVHCSAEQLATMAQQLEQMVGRFRT